jgi:cleavage stimulation factor subunit 2
LSRGLLVFTISKTITKTLDQASGTLQQDGTRIQIRLQYVFSNPYHDPSTNNTTVGNIPFVLSEEEIVAILSQAGTVTKFRLMVDSATGKPKGFGFADFADADAAASAVRNLNDFEIQGRKIRVDWPHAGEKDAAPAGYDATTAATAPPMPMPAAPALPPLPGGADLPPNLKCIDAISQTLSTLPPQQLLDVLTQMKGLAISDPGRAIELLKQAPQLSYAIFQALILMNLVDPKVLAQVVEQTARPPSMTGIPPPQPQQPPQQYSGFPPPIPGQQFQPPRPQPQSQYAPPQMPQQPPQPQQNQNDLLQQVLAMDQRTIDSLPPTERLQIMQLRQQMGVR